MNLQEFHQSIDTNNFVEAWHSLLKRHYVTSRKRRADMVVFILTKAVEYDFRVDNFQSFINMGKMTPTQIHLSQRQRQANEISVENAIDMMDISDMNCYKVQSFTNAPLSYDVVIDSSSAVMLSCSCPDWDQYHLACKHMFLVSRIYCHISLPEIVTTSAPLQTLRTSTPITIESLQQQRDFLNKLKRIEKAFRSIKDQPQLTEDVFNELNILADRLESRLEQLDNSRSFSHQLY